MTHDEIRFLLHSSGISWQGETTFAVLEKSVHAAIEYEQFRCATIARQMNAPAVAEAIEGEGK